MKISITHENQTTKIKAFSSLTELLRKRQCAQDRSGVWSPGDKVETFTRQWAEPLGYQVVKQGECLSVTL